jgi:hypothetical protein
MDFMYSLLLICKKEVSVAKMAVEIAPLSFGKKQLFQN